MHIDDDTRLRHMHDAAGEAMAFARGKTRQDLDNNRQLALSLLKCIEIVGEAAGRVTDGFRRRHPSIPWSQIVGLRNRISHGYDEIDRDRVWEIVQTDLPPLVREIEQILS